MREHCGWAVIALCAWLATSAFGQGFAQIVPIPGVDPLYGPSGVSPYGEYWIGLTRVDYAWALAGYEDGWAVDFGNAARTIGLIDTGIDVDHPEFAGNWRVGSKIHPDSRSFLDGGASLQPAVLICDCDGASYDENDIGDVLWETLGGEPHGTISAGIAGAYAQNGVGIEGVCWDCGLLVLRVAAAIESARDGCTYEGCSYSAQTVADAIRYAAGWDPEARRWGPVRARVISTALEDATMYGGACVDGVVSSAVDEAYERGCVIVAIAGNRVAGVGSEACWEQSGPEDPTCEVRADWTAGVVTHPLSWNPKTITVGGVCRTGLSWQCRSNVNPMMEELGECGAMFYPEPEPDGTAPVISLVAPIEDMVVTTAYDADTGRGAEYGFLDESASGTSWAAPQVAGVVALMLGRDPSLTPGEVKYILEATAQDIDEPGYDRRTGFGLMDAQAAMEYVIRHMYPADWNGDGRVELIDLIWYTNDLAAHRPMSDLTLDGVFADDDLAVFLVSFSRAF